ncbi:MAG: endonuclease domain-containing protein [Parvularculaceae bacterium]
MITLNPFARRSMADDASRQLWARIRNRRLDGLLFQKDKRIGKYGVDFVCPKARLVIEVDGGKKADSPVPVRDTDRDHFFERKGYFVLRYWDEILLENIDGVIENVQSIAAERLAARKRRK